MACRPLSVQSWPRDPVWQEALRQIIAHVMQTATVETRKILLHLQQMDSAALETFATDILTGQFDGMDLGAAPFVAAALQVYWTYYGKHAGRTSFCCQRYQQSVSGMRISSRVQHRPYRRQRKWPALSVLFGVQYTMAYGSSQMQ